MISILEDIKVEVEYIKFLQKKVIYIVQGNSGKVKHELRVRIHELRVQIHEL